MPSSYGLVASPLILANRIDGNPVTALPLQRLNGFVRAKATLPQQDKKRHRIDPSRLREHCGATTRQVALQHGRQRPEVACLIDHI